MVFFNFFVRSHVKEADGSVILQEFRLEFWPKFYTQNKLDKVQLFWEGHKNSCNLPHLLSKRQNHKEDFANFCGLLRKAELYKNFRHPPYGFDIYLVNVKTIRRMAQIFVAFSEKLNFKDIFVPNLNEAQFMPILNWIWILAACGLHSDLV